MSRKSAQFLLFIEIHEAVSLTFLTCKEGAEKNLMIVFGFWKDQTMILFREGVCLHDFSWKQCYILQFLKWKRKK